MSALPRWNLVAVDDYLVGELISPVNYEYVGGRVYAGAEKRNAHNLIATNALGARDCGLRGKRCWPYNSDTKIRLRLPHEVRFYYPDASVSCRPSPPNGVALAQDITAPLQSFLEQGEGLGVLHLLRQACGFRLA